MAMPGVPDSVQISALLWRKSGKKFPCTMLKRQPLYVPFKAVFSHVVIALCSHKVVISRAFSASLRVAPQWEQ
jgi:hypothetical protein